VSKVVFFRNFAKSSHELLRHDCKKVYSFVMDYNIGSGVSVKMNSLVEFSRMGRFLLNVDYYRIYTWKGYEGKDLTAIDPLYLNAQGDKGNALLLVINPNAEINLNRDFRINLSAFSYIRRTFYKYYPNVHFNTFELRFGLSYHL